MATDEIKVVYYSNAVNMQISPFDILMEFGKNFPVIDNDGKTKIEFEREFYLFTSPQHFKAFVEMVTRQLEIYENKFGVINLPKIED